MKVINVIFAVSVVVAVVVTVAVSAAVSGSLGVQDVWARFPATVAGALVATFLMGLASLLYKKMEQYTS